MSFTTYAEGLKHATTLANKAISTEASLSSLSPRASPLPTLQRAFAQYVAAAEAYAHLLSSALVPAAERAAVQRKWRLVLERAEKVKARAAALGARLGAAEVDEAGTEAAVLRAGAALPGPGVRGELWTGTPAEGAFRGELFRDSAQPALAEEQKRLAPVWRPPLPSGWQEDADGARTTDGPSPQDWAWTVRQGPGADCSVTAGLGACLAHNARWGTSLGRDALHPQTNGRPRASDNGKHVVKLLLNGAWRGVVIDALLPTSPTGAPLHITAQRTASSPGTGNADMTPAWLPLAVKGYFKALGGYSIPGSNPAPDVYAFTGWVPERLDLGSGFQREKEWARLRAAWDRGSVIATLGSGPRGEERGLVKLHAYGVIDVFEQEGERLLRVFDPGRPRAPTDAAGSPAFAMAGLTLGDQNAGEESSFVMSWDEVCSKFEALNLNWDPALLPVSVDRHWFWPKGQQQEQGKAAGGSDDSLRAAPRYHIRATAATAGAELWLLLSHHQTGDAPLDDVALHVFRDVRGGTGNHPLAQHATNPYANALHTLERFPLREGENVLTAIASRDAGADARGFTLRAFASAGVALEMSRVSMNLAFSETVSSALTKRTAGGHPGHATHHLNPQYHLTVASGGAGAAGKKATLRLSLQGARELAWNVKLLWGKGERVFKLVSELVLASSGPFSYGMAYVEATVEPGTYTVLVSSWDREVVGDYTLTAECSAAVTLSPIPQEGAGMFARTVTGRWDADSAGGRPSGGSYGLNPSVEFVLAQPTSVQARLTLCGAPAAVPLPINVTLFARAAGGALGQQLATSGPYVEEISGAALARTRLPPGVYIAIPSTYEAGMRGEWTLEVWGDRAFTAEMVPKARAGA